MNKRGEVLDLLEALDEVVKLLNAVEDEPHAMVVYSQALSDFREANKRSVTWFTPYLERQLKSR